MNNVKRIDWIDSIKGMTIIAVVIGHCLDGYLKSDMFPTCKDVFYNIWYFIYSYHMPLFFVISGITMYLAYVDKNKNIDKSRFKSQILNLFILYTIWAIILWCFKMVFSDSVNTGYTLNDLFKMYLLPLGNYWYLYVLCAIYIIVYVLKLQKMNGSLLFFGTFIVNVLASYAFSIGLIPFTIYRILFNLFFVCVGIIICTSPKIFENKVVMIICSLYSLLSLIAFYIFKFDYYSMVFFKTAMALSTSIVFLWLFKNIKFLNNKFLSLCGKYCIYIYLVHFYITAGNRKLLPIIGITNPYISLIVNVISATLISLFIAKVASKISVSDCIFRPNKFIKRLIRR